MRAALRFARRRRGRLLLVGLAAWFLAMVVVGAGLLARHVVAFPPPVDEKLTAAIATLRRPESRLGWVAVHVLYSECRCSQRIVEHLLATERPRDWSEMILWVGSSAPPLALEQRFDVRRGGTADLARYGIESAPLLVAADPEGHVRYAGGYSDRKQGPVLDDLRILEAARRPTRVASLPVFGCAFSDRLRRELAALPSM